jgi:hypothetical protein
MKPYTKDDSIVKAVTEVMEGAKAVHTVRGDDGETKHKVLDNGKSIATYKNYNDATKKANLLIKAPIKERQPEHKTSQSTKIHPVHTKPYGVKPGKRDKHIAEETVVTEDEKIPTIKAEDPKSAHDRAHSKNARLSAIRKAMLAGAKFTQSELENGRDRQPVTTTKSSSTGQVFKPDVDEEVVHEGKIDDLKDKMAAKKRDKELDDYSEPKQKKTLSSLRKITGKSYGSQKEPEDQKEEVVQGQNLEQIDEAPPMRVAKDGHPWKKDSGWKTSKPDSVTDKSGAVHTTVSRVRDLARKARDTEVKKELSKEEVETVNELSNERLGAYKTAAAATIRAADKVGDTKKANKHYSGLLKATRKQFDNDTKKKHKIKEEFGLDDSECTIIEDIQLNEVITKATSAGDVIHDFVHSKNPKFDGKSPEKRKQMALAAYYSKQRNEEVSTLGEVSKGLIMKTAKAGFEREKESLKKGDMVNAVKTGKKVVSLLHRSSLRKEDGGMPFMNKLLEDFTKKGAPSTDGIGDNASEEPQTANPTPNKKRDAIVEKMKGLRKESRDLKDTEKEEAYSLGTGHFGLQWKGQPHPKNPHKPGSNEHFTWRQEYDRGVDDRRRELGEDVGDARTHPDETEDKELFKKMVKKDCLKTEGDGKPVPKNKPPYTRKI